MQTETIRNRLNEDLARLVRRDAALDRHLRNQDGRLEADFGDRAAFTEMDEVIEALDDVGRAEIEALQNALTRLDNGTYGICLSCGAQIDPRRLEVLPSTPVCVNCAKQGAQ